MTGTEQTIIPNFDEPLRQDVLHAKRAANELLCRQGAALRFAAVSIFVTKGDLTLINFLDTIVANRHPEDVCAAARYFKAAWPLPTG